MKNVVFDLGNVLLRFAPIEYLRTKINDEEKVQKIYRDIFLSEEWVMLDQGTVTEEEAKKRIIARNLENKNLIQKCMEQWYQLLTPIEETVSILKELKNKGYKAFIISNFHLTAYTYVTKHYKFFTCFDGQIISYQEKLLKPQREIYERLIIKYDLKPSETLFIDDTQANIEGAKLLGIHAILYKNSEQLRQDLVDLRVL